MKNFVIILRTLTIALMYGLPNRLISVLLFDPTFNALVKINYLGIFSDKSLDPYVGEHVGSV